MWDCLVAQMPWRVGDKYLIHLWSLRKNIIFHIFQCTLKSSFEAPSCVDKIYLLSLNTLNIAGSRFLEKLLILVISLGDLTRVSYVPLITFLHVLRLEQLVHDFRAEVLGNIRVMCCTVQYLTCYPCASKMLLAQTKTVIRLSLSELSNLIAYRESSVIAS